MVSIWTDAIAFNLGQAGWPLVFVDPCGTFLTQKADTYNHESDGLIGIGQPPKQR